MYAWIAIRYKTNILSLNFPLYKLFTSLIDTLSLIFVRKRKLNRRVMRVLLQSQKSSGGWNGERKVPDMKNLSTPPPVLSYWNTTQPRKAAKPMKNVENCWEYSKRNIRMNVTLLTSHTSKIYEQVHSV